MIDEKMNTIIEKGILVPKWYMTSLHFLSGRRKSEKYVIINVSSNRYSPTTRVLLPNR